MESRRKILRKTIRKNPPSYQPLLALDIENDPETGAFICAAVYGETRYRSHSKWKIERIDEFFKDHYTFLSFLEDLRHEGVKEVPTRIVVFNASYDYWFVIRIMDDAELLTNGSNIITGKLKNGIPIMDLTNLTRQGSLEDWIKYLNMEEEYGLKKESLDNLEIRVKSDAKATWILGDYLEKFFINELGIPLKLTIASAARYLFTLKFFNDYWIREERDLYLSTMERAAYRGGRTECFIKGKETNYSYDVNSMYLSVMRDELIPDPNTARLIRAPDKLPDDGLYIADVTIKVPEQYVGVLPVLDPNTGKLIFPTGKFRASYAGPELNYTINECGVEVLEIHNLITYKGKHYFKDYAEFIWKKRKEYKDKHNEGMDILIKYLGNTLYGGFGQRNKDTYFGKLEDFSLEGSKPVNSKVNTIQGVDYITATFGGGEDSSHTFPCVPVFITSYSRILLLKALRANQHILIYTDTDSMKLRKEAVDVMVGDNLGEWEFEGKSVLEFYKPKMYGGKCKGVPKRAELVWNDSERCIYVFEKPNKMRESFRRGMVPALWKRCTKDVTKEDDKRRWVSAKYSVPLDINAEGVMFKPLL